MAFSRRGGFVRQTSLLEMQQMRRGALKTRDFTAFLTRLMLRIDEMSRAINKKNSGEYLLEQFANGEEFPPVQIGTSSAARAMSKQTFLAGPLLNAAPTVIAHGITTTANTLIIAHSAWASDTTNRLYIPLPYVDVSGTVAAGSVELRVDTTNITITPTGNATNFDQVQVTLRWIDI